MGVSSLSTPESRTFYRVLFGSAVVFTVGATVALINTKKPNDEERESPAKGGSRRTHRIHRMHRMRRANGTRKA